MAKIFIDVAVTCYPLECKHDDITAQGFFPQSLNIRKANEIFMCLLFSSYTS